MSHGSPELLSRVDLLQGLAPEILSAIEQRGRWHRYGVNEQILDRDSASRDVYLVAEGCVEVVNYSAAGREVAYGQVLVGGYFGELSAIDGERRSASVIALEKSLILILPAEVFSEILSEHPVLAVRVLRRLAHIIRVADNRIMDLSTLKAVQRIYVEVLGLARTDAAGRCIVSPIPTQEIIARRASTARETVARVLSQLAKAGIVERKGRTLTILDKQRLAALARVDSDDPETLR